MIEDINSEFSRDLDERPFPTEAELEAWNRANVRARREHDRNLRTSGQER